MQPSRYDRVCEVFWKACELAAEERGPFLDQECAGDAELRAEVESMIAADQDSRFQQFTQVGEEMRAQAEVEAAPAHSPLRIGPFRIQGVLGEGGMGVVYLAQQDRPHRIVALKVLQPNLISDRTLARFEHEAEILARLQHPGIARLYEVGTDQSDDRIRPWFAMERVEGTTILDHAEQKQLSLDQRMALFSTVCDAVHHAHLKGVIHRDLKPPNILVDDNGQARVLDFGIARLSEADAEAMALTGDFRQLVGTIPYMSPEQASGEFKDLDARSDVYSLGVILYELISGQLPYPVRDTAILEAVRIVKERAPLPLDATPAHPDEDVDVIVRHALEKEKERRYQSASELGADIGRYLRREPIHARPPSAWYLLRRLAARHRALVVAFVALFLTLLTATIVSTMLYQEAREANEGFQRMADIEVLQDLLLAADELWPMREPMIPRMEQWLSSARDLLTRLPLHRQTLEGMPPPGSRGETGGPVTLAQISARFYFGMLRTLVQDLQALQAPGGQIDRMQQRMQTARQVGPATLEEPAGRWKAAIASIGRIPRYQGVPLAPQEGLIPLRQDPQSGLWEFYLWESGAEPRLDPTTDRWIVRPGTALVFVLVPGGTFRMGASSEPDSLQHDPLAMDDYEGPVHSVTLDPFFLSKYELTQDQWYRVMESHPSSYEDESEQAPIQPVESISWWEAEIFCGRLDLLLPTEAQWEYACRADTVAPYYFGEDISRMPAFENVAGQEMNEGLVTLELNFAPWDDGWHTLTPVATFDPNPWGFHDLLGNASEWCRDGFEYYSEVEPGPGDGFRGSSAERVTRGGDYYNTPRHSRCASRSIYEPEGASNHLGFRPSRPVTR